MKITLPGWAKSLLPALVGTATAQTIIAFCDSGLSTAVTALAKGDIGGFIAALPAQIQAPVQAYIAAEAAKLAAKV